MEIQLNSQRKKDGNYPNPHLETRSEPVERIKRMRTGEWNTPAGTNQLGITCSEAVEVSKCIRLYDCRYDGECNNKLGFGWKYCGRELRR